MLRALQTTTRSITQSSKVSRSLSDSLSKSDRLDAFTIKLKTRSSFSAVLRGKGKNADINLELRNSRGTLLAVSKKPGAKLESLRMKTLAPGTYTLRTTLKEGKKANYTLNYTATSLVPPDRAGNLPGTARAVKIKSTPSIFSDYVGPDDTNDYYKFTVGSAEAPSSKFKLAIQNIGTNTFGRVILRDSLNNVVKTLYSSHGETTIDQTLASGTYYVQVEPSIKGARYTLSMAADPIPDFAGSTAGNARPVTLSSTPVTFDEFVGMGDKTDFYSFTVTQNSVFNLQTVGTGGTLLGGGIDVTLRNSSLNTVKRIYSPAFDGGGVAIANQLLTPGTYYVQIEPFSPSYDSFYSVTLSTTPT